MLFFHHRFCLTKKIHKSNKLSFSVKFILVAVRHIWFNLLIGFHIAITTHMQLFQYDFKIKIKHAKKSIVHAIVQKMKKICDHLNWRTIFIPFLFLILPSYFASLSHLCTFLCFFTLTSSPLNVATWRILCASFLLHYSIPCFVLFQLPFQNQRAHNLLSTLLKWYPVLNRIILQENDL